jgi:uncharacterized protein
MTADPREGVDAAGYLTTGVDAANIANPYAAVIADCRDTIVTEVGAALHGLYLYGSVATGQAVPPVSDLDLGVILHTASATVQCAALAELLTERWRSTVREVGVSPNTTAVVLADDEVGWSERAFLKHYCLGIAGIDLRPELAPCRPDATLARLWIGDLGAGLRTRRAELAAGRPAPDIAGPLSRRLLRTAAMTFTVRQGGWSTAGPVGAERIAAEAPRFAADAAGLLDWDRLPFTGPVVSSAAVVAVIDGLGDWLCREVAAL